MTEYGVESYVGVPLFRQNGEFFGTLCALDTEPRHFPDDVIKSLNLFANLIAFELEAEEIRQEREETLKLTQQSNDARARFMGILGHDLRSPLNTIVMAATLQKMSPPDSDKIPKMADKILKTADRMKFLIEDLLDTTQTLQGQEITINRETTALQKICRLIIEEFKIANPNHKIEFFAETECVGEWDAGRLQQVLSNLLSNAVNYGTSTKPIKVDLIADCDRVVLQVNNQGEIIQPEIMENLFQPFWRGATKRSNSSGLGLGLYIVKQIVEAHDGKISVESNREYGTTFTVIFDQNSGWQNANLN